MANDLQRLRDDGPLLRLLAHYVELVQEDRKLWQDRVMSLDGLEAPTLARLHGELIAGDWLEINVGSPTGKRPGAVESSYRVTLAGMRAIERIQSGTPDEEEEAVVSMPEPRPKAPPRIGRRPRKVDPNAPPPHAA